MKKILTLAGLCAFALSAQAQMARNESPQNDFVFTTVKAHPITLIQNQARTSTCWCFSSLAFLESELIRMGKGEHNLSEMFVVWNTYNDKADRYIRTEGNINFAQGGGFEDYLHVINHYGIVPEEVMTGLNYGEEAHVHNELEAVLKGYVSALVRRPNGKLSTAWKSGFAGILDAYLGAQPKNFTYKGKNYTPKSFAAELAIPTGDYVNLTSYTHHPFYTQFALEIADNWLWSTSYNVPLDELMAICDNAINTGYTILWASDVSELGFTRNGVAAVPEADVANMSGSDQARWLGLSAAARNNELSRLIAPGSYEKTITQELRQIGYDEMTTTDDHGMQIFGIAKDQTGKKYYMVKNSWGPSGNYEGIWYVSENFVAYKTMDIMVHKNAIPAALKQKLGIK